MRDGLKEKSGGESALLKLCAFIVDKRNLIFLIFAILSVFSIFSRNWVRVENDVAYYLPDTTETRQGLNLMEEEFKTYGSITLMVANVSYDQALAIQDHLENMDGVFSVNFDDTDEYYNNGSAKFAITFSYDEKDEICLEIQDSIIEYISDYDYYLSTTLGDVVAKEIDSQMKVTSIIVVIIVILVLFLATEAYAEIPVLLITFGGAALLQVGTNFFFGTISFVSDSVTIVLQLALSVDYAVIFLHRYKEEHEYLAPREAVIEALSKAIPEIAGSSMTTIGGLIAMTFMAYKMGPDMGMVLIKAILLSLLSVFFLMPGILMVFANLMDNTKHRKFVPLVPFIGKFAYKTRFVVPPIFLIVLIAAFIVSGKCNYVYGFTTVKTPIESESVIAERMIAENFTSTNLVAMMVPTGEFEQEGNLIRALENLDEIDHCQGLANIEALNGYMLTDKLTPRQFSELINLDYEVAELVYAAYAVNDEDYAKAINGLETYRVPLVDMFLFVKEEVDEGYVTLDDDLMDTLNEAYEQMNAAKEQLRGENYSRILVYMTVPEEGEETYQFLDKLHVIANKYYPDADIYLCGNSVSRYDLSKTFSRDNVTVSIVSILVVLVVLLFTFKSAGMPVLLIIVIQGSIWINFSCSTVIRQNIYFLGYLIVSSIQMGANIDYAIVIASRYTDIRKSQRREETIRDTMNQAFPTVITSGTILALAGMTIGKMTSNVVIFNIGQTLGRGTVISILITLFVLPQILLLGDTILAKTAFVMTMPVRPKESSGGLVRVDGMVRGKINGQVTGVMHAVIMGDVSAFVEAGDMTKLPEGEILDLDQAYIDSETEADFYVMTNDEEINDDIEETNDNPEETNVEIEDNNVDENKEEKSDEE